MPERTYQFDNVAEMYDVADRLPEATRHDIYAHHTERDEWENVGYRDSLWLPGYGSVGDVSSNRDYYHVIQYGDIVEAVADAVDQYGGAIEAEGTVALSASGHKMTGRTEFYGDTTIEPVDGDRITLGLQFQSGHSGFHAVKYDVGAERQVCANGMVAFVSDLHYDQTHSEPFKPGLAQHAVDAVVEGVDDVEDRLQRAREERFRNEDEALLVLADFGIDQYLSPDDAYDVLRDSLRAEMPDGRDAEPSLYDTYNAATRALTHEADLPEHVRADALAQAGNLLDYPGYGLPEADHIGEQAVNNRIEFRVEQDEDVEPVLENERERLSELREAYND